MESQKELETVLSDIEKLEELMATLKLIGEGYTLNQRIEHHEEMARLLKKQRDLQ